nr:hypothetical protein [Roseomonas sp. SXEYE001]
MIAEPPAALLRLQAGPCNAVDPHRLPGVARRGAWIHHTRSAGTSASRKGRLAVIPARIDTGEGREKAIRPAAASAGADAWAVGADVGGAAS